MLTLCVSLDILPTKSSPFQQLCTVGLRYLALKRRCINVWCLATMLNDFLPFSKDHAFKKEYSSKNPFPRASDVSYSSLERNVPALSHTSMSFSKLFAAEIIAFSSLFSVPANILSRTGINAGRRCLVSPPLHSNVAHLLHGFLGQSAWTT